MFLSLDTHCLFPIMRLYLSLEIFQLTACEGQSSIYDGDLAFLMQERESKGLLQPGSNFLMPCLGLAHSIIAIILPIGILRKQN